MNLYAYAGDDPANNVDPSGMDCLGLTGPTQINGVETVESCGQSGFVYISGYTGYSEGVPPPQPYTPPPPPPKPTLVTDSRKFCSTGNSGWNTMADWADTFSTTTGIAAYGSGVAAVVTSETGVGLISFGGAAFVLEGVSRLSAGVAVVARVADRNYGGALLSATSAAIGFGGGSLLDKFGERAVEQGFISNRHLAFLRGGALADSMLNDQLLQCTKG